jgi:hypothetical protein
MGGLAVLGCLAREASATIVAFQKDYACHADSLTLCRAVLCRAMLTAG